MAVSTYLAGQGTRASFIAMAYSHRSTDLHLEALEMSLGPGERDEVIVEASPSGTHETLSPTGIIRVVPGHWAALPLARLQRWKALHPSLVACQQRWQAGHDHDVDLGRGIELLCIDSRLTRQVAGFHAR